MQRTELRGACLCGDVRFLATGVVKRVSACYCGQCRRQNGGGPFFGAEMQGELAVDGESLRWFASSERAERAFCVRCGSSMFWQSTEDRSYFDVSLGTLGDDHPLQLDAHIFVDACPGYMTVPHTAPHFREADVLANPLSEQ